MNDLVLACHLLGGIGFIIYGLWRGGWCYEGVILRASALFAVAFGLLWMLLPIGLTASGDYWWSKSGYQEGTLLKAFLGYFSFGAAALLAAKALEGHPRAVADYQWHTAKKELPTILFGLALLSVVYLVASSVLAAQIISVGGFQQYLLLRNQLGVGSGALNLGLSIFPSVIVVLTVLATVDRSNRRVAFFAAAVIMVLIAVLVGASTGSRTRMLQPVLFFAAGLLVAHAPIGLPRIVRFSTPILVIGLFFVGTLMGAVRGQIAGGSGLSMDLAESVSVEAYQEFENGWWLIENQPLWEPLGGSTIAAAFVFPIPRALWPEKPVGSGALMVNLVRPRSIVAGISTTRSPVTTGMPVEGFLNFGWLGFPILGLFYGVVLALMTRGLTKAKSTLHVALWAVMMVKVMDGMNMEFFGWSANMLMAAMPFLFLFILVWLRNYWKSEEPSQLS